MTGGAALPMRRGKVSQPLVCACEEPSVGVWLGVGAAFLHSALYMLERNQSYMIRTDFYILYTTFHFSSFDDQFCSPWEPEWSLRWASGVRMGCGLPSLVWSWPRPGVSGDPVRL